MKNPPESVQAVMRTDEPTAGSWPKRAQWQVDVLRVPQVAVEPHGLPTNQDVTHALVLQALQQLKQRIAGFGHEPSRADRYAAFNRRAAAERGRASGRAPAPGARLPHGQE